MAKNSWLRAKKAVPLCLLTVASCSSQQPEPDPEPIPAVAEMAALPPPTPTLLVCPYTGDEPLVATGTLDPQTPGPPLTLEARGHSFTVQRQAVRETTSFRLEADPDSLKVQLTANGKDTLTFAPPHRAMLKLSYRECGKVDENKIHVYLLNAQQQLDKDLGKEKEPGQQRKVARLEHLSGYALGSGN